MEAVANPARHRELFFVADGTGGHAFAETLEQHNRNVANWRRIERERGDAASVGGGTAPPAAAADAAPAAPATPPRTTR